MAEVRLRYFAAAAEAAGVDEESLELEGTLADLRTLLIARYGSSMEHVLRSGSFLVDRVVTRDFTRPIGAQVDVLPPFAGG